MRFTRSSDLKLNIHRMLSSIEEYPNPKRKPSYATQRQHTVQIKTIPNKKSIWRDWHTLGEFKRYHLPDGGLCYADNRPQMVGVPLLSIAQISCKRLKPPQKLLEFAEIKNKLPNIQTSKTVEVVITKFIILNIMFRGSRTTDLFKLLFHNL